MTLTLEIAPEIQTVLENEAQRHGQSVNDYASALLAQAAEEAAQEAAEDTEDIADAERILANSDPSKRRTLVELRNAIAAQREAKVA